MSLPQVDPLLIDQLIVVISGAFMKSFSADEQAVIGTFLATLGSVISFNSVYSLYIQGQMPPTTSDDNKDNDQEDDFELLKQSIDKIKEEIEKMKTKH